MYGVVCFCRLISVQPKLKLTCFLHALWSSVNVSWAAARVSRFSRRDYTQGSSGYRVVVRQTAVCFFSLSMTNVPSGSRDQVEDQIRLCGGLLPFNICPAAWLFSHYSEIKPPQNASVNMFKLIKHSSTIVESRCPYKLLSVSFLCTCVLVTKWGPEYTWGGYKWGHCGGGWVTSFSFKLSKMIVKVSYGGISWGKQWLQH